MKLLAIFAILLLPLRMAEAAEAHPSLHALEAALNLGHCSGSDEDARLHPRAHAHCALAGAELTLPDSRIEPQLPVAMPPPPVPVAISARGLGPEAPTPPPRRS